MNLLTMEKNFLILYKDRNR